MAASDHLNSDQIPPGLRQGQIWNTSIGKVMITRDPEEAMHGEYNVEHIHEEHGENPGWLYTRQGRWSRGPDATEVKFHERLHPKDED